MRGHWILVANRWTQVKSRLCAIHRRNNGIHWAEQISNQNAPTGFESLWSTSPGDVSHWLAVSVITQNPTELKVEVQKRWTDQTAFLLSQQKSERVHLPEQRKRQQQLDGECWTTGRRASSFIVDHCSSFTCSAVVLWPALTPDPSANATGHRQTASQRSPRTGHWKNSQILVCSQKQKRNCPHSLIILNFRTFHVLKFQFSMEC